ncbi:sporulation protein [Staphylococcus aureus]
MFEKVLTSIGIKSLEINTLIATKSIYPEGEIAGRINIKGGNSEQTINKVVLTLIERYDNPDKDSQFPVLDNELYTYALSNEVTIKPNDNVFEEFKFHISDLQCKSNSNSLILKTHVFVSHAVDEYDEDEILLK